MSRSMKGPSGRELSQEAKRKPATSHLQGPLKDLVLDSHLAGSVSLQVKCQREPAYISGVLQTVRFLAVYSESTYIPQAHA